jgi:hypothetical protein
MGRERGVGGMFIAVVLLIIGAVVLALLALMRTSGGVDRSSETSRNLSRIAAALEQFAATSERLPCPANPAADTGDAEPNAAATACTYPGGTVPWRAIGLRREESLDAWGWKISYRVYSGATGITQAGGASMVHCDTAEPAPAGATTAGLCKATHDTTEAEFLAGKGLALNDFGTNVSDAAYVLVSHGPSGLGAYAAQGGQKPNPTSADELSNLGAGPFVAKAAVTGVAPEAATHFDDVLAYRRLADFVRRANLAARDWPEPGAVLTDVTLNTATVATAMGTTPSYGDLGTTTLNLPGATLTAFDGGGNENISFQSVNGTEAIGGTSGGGGISSNSSEGVRIDFAVKARQLAVTLNDFGRQTGGGPPRVERVQFRFYDGATQVLSVDKDACRNDPTLAAFSIDVTVDFDRVEIRALPTTESTATEFYLAQFKSCGAGVTCATSMATPAITCT